MNLIIDHREQEIKKYFKEYNNVTFENLDLGDIRFEYNQQLILLIERKNLKDLANSIKSGRYREQKIRLLNSQIPKDKIVYLIEGKLEPDVKIDKVPYNTFVGSMVNTIIRDNFKVYQTQDLEATLYFLQSIYNKLDKNILRLDIIEKNYIDDNNLNQEYLATLKSKKKDNLNPYNCYILQLSQIPGISIQISSAIANQFKNFKELYQYYDNSDSKGLKDITYSTSTGKLIRIGEKRSQIIYQYLYGIA